MSSNVRSFFRSDRSQRLTTKSSHAKDHFLLHDVNHWIPNINSQQNPLNSSCCGGDEKKNQADASRTIKETIEHTKAMTDPMEASDHKIEKIVQQHAPRVEIDDDLKDLFGHKEITQAMVNQLAQRALTGPMNSNNDDPPRLCTKKHVRNKSRLEQNLFFSLSMIQCSFANEPLTIKPVTCVPGIGPVHGDLCEKQGYKHIAYQFISIHLFLKDYYGSSITLSIHDECE
jgi:hypothetical protein